jgi:ABC-type Fe3+ transport system permease subunit
VRWVAAVVLLAILVVSFSPVIALVDELSAETTTGLDGNGGVDSVRAHLIWTSLQVAGVATALSIVWGLATAMVIASRGRTSVVIEALSWVPLLLPNVVVALGWLYIAGPGGYLGDVLPSRTGGASTVGGLLSPVGAGFVLSLCLFPCVTIPCVFAFRSLDRDAMCAAEVAASPWRRFVVITGPIVRPWTLTGATLVFLLALADYGVPSTLSVNVFPVEIYQEFGSRLDRRQALYLSSWLLTATVVLSVVRHVFGRVDTTTTGVRRQEVGRASPIATIVAVLIVLASSVVPLVFLAVKAGGADVYVRALKIAGEQILESLRIGGRAAILMTLVAVVFALAYRASGRVVRTLSETALLALFTLPGAVVALGLKSGKTATKGRVWEPMLEWVWSDDWICAVTSSLRYIAVPALIVAIGLVAIRAELLHAAASSGAGSWRTGGRVVLPLVLPALLAAFALSFVLALGELSAAVLVYSPGRMTLPVRLASLLHLGEESVMAALCVMISGFAIGVVVLARLLIFPGFRIVLSHEGRR